MLICFGKYWEQDIFRLQSSGSLDCQVPEAINSWVREGEETGIQQGSSCLTGSGLLSSSRLAASHQEGLGRLGADAGSRLPWGSWTKPEAFLTLLSYFLSSEHL